MKRIFIIQNTPLNEPLPLSVYFTGLLSNFKKSKKYEVNLIVSKSKNVPKKIKEVCNKIYQIDSSTYSIKDNIKFSLKVFSILKKENKRKSIDVVHCLYPNSSLLGGVLFKKRVKNNVELIYDVRSPWIEMSIGRGHVKRGLFFYKKILYTEERYLCKYVDKFIFITEGLKEHYLKTFISQKDSKVYISPSGVDIKIFRYKKNNIRKRYNIKKKEILIGHIGSMNKLRELDKFLSIFSNLPKNFKLMFVGSGDDITRLKEKVTEFGIKERVIFVGKIPYKEIPKYISSFDYGLCHLPDIFIFKNSFPLKILEYLACGVPVLASKLKTHFDISKKLKGTYVYKNTEDLLRIMREKKRKVKTNLREYSWSSLIKNYEKIWGDLGALR